MKKHLLLHLLSLALISATAQEIKPLKGITTTYGISQVAILNTPAYGNYAFSVFLTNDTVNKGLYSYIGFGTPSKNFTFFTNIGFAYKLKKHPKTFIDLGVIVQSDLKSKDVESNGIAAIETAIRFQTIGKNTLINWRLGIAAGYVTDYKYNANSLNAETKIDNNSGFRIMPTLTVGLNLFTKKE